MSYANLDGALFDYLYVLGALFIIGVIWQFWHR